MLEGPEGLFLTRTPRNLRVSRVASAVRLGAASALVTVAFVLVMHVYVRTRVHRLLAAEGEVVQAQVISLAYANAPPPPRWTIDYRFEAADGFSYAGRDVVPVARLKEVDKLKPVDLTYYPPNPSFALVGRVTPERAREEILSRWKALLLAPVLVAAAAAIVLRHRRKTWLVRYGALVPGRVTGKEEAGEGEMKARLVRFAFTPEGRDEVSGETEVDEAAFERLREGATELVFYDPKRPESHVLYAASPYEIEEI